MITYPLAGQGVTWTPVAGGAAAETSYTVNTRISASNVQGIAQLPVRLSTSNEVTKTGIARSVIKAEAYLDAGLMDQVTPSGTTTNAKVGAYTKTLTPVQVHLVVAAPRGAAQLAISQDDAGLYGLVAFMARNLFTVLLGRSSDGAHTTDSWSCEKLMNALKGLQMFDPVSGIYGSAESPE